MEITQTFGTFLYYQRKSATASPSPVPQPLENATSLYSAITVSLSHTFTHTLFLPFISLNNPLFTCLNFDFSSVLGIHTY